MESQRTVVIKYVGRSKVNKSFKARNTVAYRMLENQVAVLKKMRHPNVVQLLDFIDVPGSPSLYIAVEHVSRGSLESLIAKSPLDSQAVWRYARQLIEAVDYTHSVAELVHRSIAVHNLMLDEGGCLKVADTGLGFVLPEDDERQVASLAHYAAPELYKSGSHKNYATDVWSMGVCIFFMSKRMFPFAGADAGQIRHEAVTKSYSLPQPHYISIDQTCPDSTRPSRIS